MYNHKYVFICLILKLWCFN